MSYNIMGLLKLHRPIVYIFQSGRFPLTMLIYVFQ